MSNLNRSIYVVAYAPNKEVSTLFNTDGSQWALIQIVHETPSTDLSERKTKAIHEITF